ncbi:unnamed protein product, partial [Tetraodon nigroviridis]
MCLKMGVAKESSRPSYGSGPRLSSSSLGSSRLLGREPAVDSDRFPRVSSAYKAELDQQGTLGLRSVVVNAADDGDSKRAKMSPNNRGLYSRTPSALAPGPSLSSRGLGSGRGTPRWVCRGHGGVTVTLKAVCLLSSWTGFFSGRRFQRQSFRPVLPRVAPPAPASGPTAELPHFPGDPPLPPASHLLPLRRRHGAASPARSRGRGVGRHPLHPPPPVEALLPPLQPGLLQRIQRSLPGRRRRRRRGEIRRLRSGERNVLQGTRRSGFGGDLRQNGARRPPGEPPRGLPQRLHPGRPGVPQGARSHHLLLAVLLPARALLPSPLPTQETRQRREPALIREVGAAPTAAHRRTMKRRRRKRKELSDWEPSGTAVPPDLGMKSGPTSPLSPRRAAGWGSAGIRRFHVVCSEVRRSRRTSRRRRTRPATTRRSSAGSKRGVACDAALIWQGDEVSRCGCLCHGLFSNRRLLLEDSDEDEGDMCRICQMGEDSASNPLIQPCRCTGSLQYVHQDCIKRWLCSKISSATNLEAITTCELCKEKLHLNIDNFDIQELYRTHVQSEYDEFISSGLYLVVLLHFCEQRFSDVLGA